MGLGIASTEGRGATDLEGKGTTLISYVHFSTALMPMHLNAVQNVSYKMFRYIVINI
jgi:hypothetical protein